jgi:hypothetical protein
MKEGGIEGEGCEEGWEKLCGVGVFGYFTDEGVEFS